MEEKEELIDTTHLTGSVSVASAVSFNSRGVTLHWRQRASGVSGGLQGRLTSRVPSLPGVRACARRCHGCWGGRQPGVPAGATDAHSPCPKDDVVRQRIPRCNCRMQTCGKFRTHARSVDRPCPARNFHRSASCRRTPGRLLTSVLKGHGNFLCRDARSGRQQAKEGGDGDHCPVWPPEREEQGPDCPEALSDL